jgi:hypothetical protein
LARQRKPPKSLSVLVRDAFNTPLGKPALDELIRLYVHKNAFDKDPYQTAFLAGQRSLVLTLAHYTHGQQLEIDDDGGNADHDTNDI